MNEKLKGSEIHSVLKGWCGGRRRVLRCFEGTLVRHARYVPARLSRRTGHCAIRRRRAHGHRGLLAILGHGMRLSTRSRCDKCHHRRQKQASRPCQGTRVAICVPGMHAIFSPLKVELTSSAPVGI